MAAFAGCCVVILLIWLQWLAWMVAANEESIPVWTRLDGSSSLNQPSTLIAGKQYPGCRADSAIWTQASSGLVWMFGGRDGSGTALNEVWQYDVPSQEWTNVRRGKEQEWPGPRFGAAMCGAASSTLVIYGGAASPKNLLSDTWLYHLHNESWMLLAENSQPGARASVAHWCTPDALWVLGGVNVDTDTPLIMWRFSLRTYEWAEVLADVDTGKSQEETGLGQRQGSATWVVNNTVLYLLGGKPSRAGKSCQQKKNTVTSQCDLWRFSTILHHWEHVDIDSKAQDNSKIPGCPAHTASWLGADSNLWLLSNGEGSNGACERTAHSTSDLWMLDLKLMQWNHFKGSNAAKYQLGYEILEGIPDVDNHPPPRAYCASWSLNSTHYLFGGLARNGSAGALNDLWDFQLIDAKSLHGEAHLTLAIPPVAVFFLSLGALCVLALFVFSVIFCTKCSAGPRLKPPNHFGDKIRYSPVETDEVFIT